jgi:hypothetical protein
MFTSYFCGSAAAQNVVAAFLNNRYSNGELRPFVVKLMTQFPCRAGADTVLIQYLSQRAADPACASANATNAGRGLSLDRSSEAGWARQQRCFNLCWMLSMPHRWNTDGNSIGTAVANAVLLHYFGSWGPYAGLGFEQVRGFGRYIERSDGHLRLPHTYLAAG